MAAVLHQVEVIQLLHGIGCRRQRLDDGLIGIVYQQHHMGQLDGSVTAHLGTGRDAFQHCPLGGTDQGAGAGGEVVGVQIHHADEAMADASVGLLALHIDQGILQRPEYAVLQILLHGGVDAGDVLVHVGGLEVGLRQDQPQGGRGLAHLLLHRLPVFRLGGELVTGHHSPLGHVLILGQQDICWIKAQLFKGLVHVVPPCVWTPPELCRRPPVDSFLFFLYYTIVPPAISTSIPQNLKIFLSC